MIVLGDIDGVMADFEQGFWNLWGPKYSEHPDCPTPASIGARTTFYIDDQLPDGWRKKGERLIQEDGFFRSLPVMEHAVEAVNLITSLGHDFYFCTKPIHKSACFSEKHAWVREHFGDDYTRRLIIIKDKTLIRADILVDDHPEPAKKGLLFPAWEHVVYDQPYNQGYPGRRITWREFLDEPKILLGL